MRVSEESQLIYSSLQQTYTVDGKSIEIQIYRLPDTGWTIDVVDEHGNSTVWNDEFATDQLAFDEVMRTIAEDDIDPLIGEPSQASSSVATDDALTAEEIAILDDFLSSDSIVDTSMDFATLEGYLTAITIGPRMVRPSEWIPWIWDMDDAENAPEFRGEREANRIMSLIFRHYNTIVGTFNTAPESFEPIFWEGHRWNAAEWCEGFLTGFQFESRRDFRRFTRWMHNALNVNDYFEELTQSGKMHSECGGPAADTLAVQLTSPCRVCRGLSPPSHPPATTAGKTAPVTALRAMPGAPKSRRAANGPSKHVVSCGSFLHIF